jgi:hypothetical protein
MNSKIILLIVTVLSLTGVTASAQSPDDSRVKILPTTERGVLKLLYAQESVEPIRVTFFDHSGEFASDEIQGNYPKGLLKRYNLRKFDGKDFRMQISNSKMTVIYHITTAKGGKTFNTQLEKTIYNHPMVAYRDK